MEEVTRRDGRSPSRLLLLFEDGEELLHGRRKELVVFVDDGQGAEEVFAFEFHFGQDLLAHFLGNGGLRNDGHAQFDLDRALDGFDVVELHDWLYADLGFEEGAVKGAARGHVRFEMDEVLPLQIFQSQALGFGERMVGVAGEDQRFLAQWNHLEAGVFVRIRHQAQVHHVAGHVGIDLADMTVFDMDIDRGVGLEELLQIGGQVIKPHAVDSGDPDRSGDDVLDLLEFALQGFVGGKDLLAIRSEEHTSELQSHSDLVCRLLLEKKKKIFNKSAALYKIMLLLSSVMHS